MAGRGDGGKENKSEEVIMFTYSETVRKNIRFVKVDKCDSRLDHGEDRPVYIPVDNIEYFTVDDRADRERETVVFHFYSGGWAEKYFASLSDVFDFLNSIGAE